MTLTSPSVDTLTRAVPGCTIKNLRFGLERYEAAFRENEIDETVLPNLTAEELKELGVAELGHRRKLLDGIAALRADNWGGS
jgi:SAM domain (Sterile alpha motif)